MPCASRPDAVPPIVRRPLPDDLAAFLFDLDGTLVRTPIDFAGMKQAVLRIAEAFGLDPPALGHLDILGIIEQAEIELERAGGARADLREEAERELTRYELEAAAVAEELPGAVEALTQLRAHGCRVGIVTRNCRRAVERALERVRLPHDLLLTRNDVPRAKPDPEHLLAAARTFALPVRRCAMVGDHPMDIQAGRGAGMYTIGVQTRDPSPEAFRSAEPDLILPAVGDLLSWISASSSSTGTPAISCGHA